MKTTGHTQLAKRYARALSDAAHEASALAPVEKDLRALGKAVKDNADLRDFLSSPLLSRQAQQETFLALLKKMRAHEVTQKFIRMLVANKRLPALPAIIVQFMQAAAEARGEMGAEVAAAFPLSEKDAAGIGAMLEKIYGKQVNLTLTQDESLLGGAVIKVGGKQFDASLSGKLERLKVSLKAA